MKTAYKIYSSSAGSGKTYTLTKEYLKLLFQQNDPNYFKRILAITFTNDATSEMKERIIGALQQISVLDMANDVQTKSYGLLSQIAEELQITDKSSLVKKAGEIFEQIIQNYGYFSIKTIDSFVNQIVSSFTKDLNLPFQYEVILDTSLLRAKAVERVFDKVGTTEFSYLSDLIIEIAEEMNEDNKSVTRIFDSLVEFSKEIYNDQYYQLIKKNDDLDFKDIALIKKNIFIRLNEISKEIKELGQKADDLIKSVGLEFDDFSYKLNGFPNWIIKCLDKNKHEELLSKGLGTRAEGMLEKGDYMAKTSSKKDVFSQIEDALKTIALETKAFLSSNTDEFLLLKGIYKHINNVSLMGEIKKEADAILAENNQAFLAEFNRKISTLLSSESVPYIFERLGEKFNHILIDEFQDTSDLQYYNLLPLIENSLANGHFNMLVGDPKQSIYRFRGGKVELMIHLLNKNTENLAKTTFLSENQKDSVVFSTSFVEPANLEFNYRSCKEIITFNNQLYTKIAAISGEPLVRDAYENIQQNIPSNAQEGGHVEIRFAPDKNQLQENEEELTISEWYFEQCKELVDRALSIGYNYSDIAILTRRKKKESFYLAGKFEELGYPITSADSLLLSRNSGINFLISLLQCYHEPGKEANELESKMLYYTFKEKNVPTDITTSHTSMWEFLINEGFEIDTNAMGAFGLFQLSEYLANKLGYFQNEYIKPYLFAFLDMVQSQQKTNGNSLGSFLTYWKEGGQSVSLTGGIKNAVTITTVHKSKGLEYPVVIVPFANWSLIENSRTPPWYDLKDVPFNSLHAHGKALMAAPMSTTYAKNSYLQSQFDAYASITKLEAINVLYVATTRASERLYILTEHKPEKKSAKDQETIDIKDITAYFKEYHEMAELSENGKSYIALISKGLEPESKPEQQINEEQVDFELSSHENLGRMKIKSSLERTLNEKFQKDQGNLIHTLFAYIKKAEDLQNALRKLNYEGLITEDEIPELHEAASAIMNHPTLKPFYTGNITIENERDILYKDHDIARPDRVIFMENKVVIIDYKTGQRNAKYSKQLQNYGHLYQAMGFEQIELYLVYLNPTEVIPIQF